MVLKIYVLNTTEEVYLLQLSYFTTTGIQASSYQFGYKLERILKGIYLILCAKSIYPNSHTGVKYQRMLKQRKYQG